MHRMSQKLNFTVFVCQGGEAHTGALRQLIRPRLGRPDNAAQTDIQPASAHPFTAREAWRAEILLKRHRHMDQMGLGIGLGHAVIRNTIRRLKDSTSETYGERELCVNPLFMLPLYIGSIKRVTRTQVVVGCLEYMEASKITMVKPV